MASDARLIHSGQEHHGCRPLLCSSWVGGAQCGLNFLPDMSCGLAAWRCFYNFSHVVQHIWLFSLLFLFFSFFFFRAAPQRMEIPRLGVESEHSCWSTPQPQQRHNNARSEPCLQTTPQLMATQILNPLRPGIEPTTSWFLVGFVSAGPRQELQKF